MIGPKKLLEIKKLLIEFIDNSDTPIIDEPVAITEKKIVTWAQIVEDYFRHEKDVYIFILISRFGYTPKTLNEIAIELGVTRERVRQIQESVANRYNKHVRYMGALELVEKIEEIFSQQGEKLSLQIFENLLAQGEILGQFVETKEIQHVKRLDLFETLICWLNLISNKRYTLKPIEFSVSISNLIKSGNISIEDHTTLLNTTTKERRKIKRKIIFTGGITIQETAKILARDEQMAALVLKDLNLQKIDKEWFSFKNLVDDNENSKIPLRIAGLKMLAVTPNMDVSSFHDGLRRYAGRFYASIAPTHVVEHILPILGFEISNNVISTQLSTKEILSLSEKTLIAAIRKNGSVASFLEIAEEFFLNNLSLPAVSATLRRSPIVEKVSEGLYKLRGVEISWQDIENVQNRQKRFSQDDEIAHGLDGIIRLKFTVNSYAYLTGVIGAGNVKELSGSWTILYNKSPFGTASIDEAYLWGLAKIFKKMEVKSGERMELAFNTWNRTLSLQKVNNENS